MDNPTHGMKITDLAGMIFGLAGFIFACSSYLRSNRAERLANESNARSIRNEAQAREIAFARRRSEVLDLVTAGKIAYRGVLRKVAAFEDSAKELGTDLIGPTAAQAVTWANERLAGLAIIETEVGSYEASGKTHEELLALMGTHIDTLKQMSNPSSIAEDFARSADLMERGLRVIALHKEVAVALGQARST